MSEQGHKFYLEGLSKKPHDFGIPENPRMPDEIKKILTKNKKLKEKFKKFPPSRRKMIYRQVLHAKTGETRINRIFQLLNQP